eukprot:2152007-Prymnesium_polylepis.2
MRRSFSVVRHCITPTCVGGSRATRATASFATCSPVKLRLPWATADEFDMPDCKPSMRSRSAR